MRRAGLALIFLAGCAAPAPPTAPTPPSEAGAEADACGAARFAHLVGQPRERIDPAALPARTRIITPEMMVTQDFSPDRLNIMVGTDGRVGSLRCF